MILCAIRNHFAEHNDPTRAEYVAGKYISSSEIKTKQRLPRLTLNVTDDPFFQSNIVDRAASTIAIKAGKTSHLRIAAAFKIIAERVAKIAEVAGSAADEALIKWIEFISNGAAAIRVIVPDHATAFTIFETLNDRGIALAISDLLKNFLFAAADDCIDQAQAYWLKMTGVLEATAEKDSHAAFLRHFWSSYHGLTREREIFKLAKSQVKNKKDSLRLCDDLARNARIYAALASSEHPLWNRSPESKALVASLSTLRMTQVRPLLLAICDTFHKNEVLKSLRLLVSASVRILVSQSRGGTVEKMYAELSLMIRKKQIKNAAALANELSPKVPGNNEFYEEFRNARISKDYLARYYLRELERYSNPSLGGLVVSESTADITLEHILPESTNGNWPAFDDETHASNVNRLGNLCLLAEDDNASTGNAAFSSKRKIYGASSMSLTKAIASKNSWTAKEIDERSAELASLATKVWPLSVNMVKPKATKTAAK